MARAISVDEGSTVAHSFRVTWGHIMFKNYIMAGAFLATSAAGQAHAPTVGSVAPPMELTLVDGSKVNLADLRGKVVVLNFWATWCGPCKQELPLLDGYYRATQKHGLRVFAVTTEDSVPIAQLKRVFALMAIPAVRKLKGPYEMLSGVPTNYVIDRGGRVVYAKAGAFELDDLNSILIPLLNAPAPGAG